MAIIAGIDEAGLGPLIGPLVVSASVFSLPEELFEQSLWRTLAGAVTRRNVKKSGALAIADSKQLYCPDTGLAVLERGVLGMLRQLSDPLPADLPALLGLLCPQTCQHMQQYPWYAGQSPALPRQAETTDVKLRANALAATLARKAVTLRAMRAEPVFEGELNRIFSATGNKAVAHFSIVSRLIGWAMETFGREQPMRLVVDRLGGRVYYLHELQRIFPGSAIRILLETPDKCAYNVRDNGREMEIWFCVGGESVAMPTALASMISKYLRELFMELFNQWWCGRVKDLRPTAGYYGDGRRFLRDIAPAMQQAGIDPAMLIRQR